MLAVLAVGFTAAQEPQGPSPPVPPKASPAPPKALQFDIDRFFRDFDRNRDGFLSREELPEAYRGAFERMDANRDGKLSRSELANGYAFLQPRRRPSDYVYMLIEMSDLDDNSPVEVQRAYDILRSLDKNRDGKIDPEELKTGRDSIVNHRVDYLFNQLDADKDGRISREEARGQIRENFAEIDRNRDGSLSREEMRQAILEKPALQGPAPSVSPRGTPPPARPTDR